ncbi:putative sensor histidine protein kinase (uhpB-like) [Escherichia coli]|uniref:Putative sensor histidine protein kinase (UhpB-like) n=1 Tax=Escherichia coli TaxID=562 RepID=A0A376LJ75_ECOLX|nr:putative sensor histidine protein kinase (uhpB-like) [Escherichia coli]
MSRNLRHWVISLFIVLAWGSGWLMLWTLSFYLTNNGQQAVLFLPHGVYLRFSYFALSPLLACVGAPPFADDVLAAQRATVERLSHAGNAGY